MTDAHRGAVDAFADALLHRSIDQILPLLDDDIEFTAFGPIDVFSFFGQRRGKPAVTAALTDMLARFTIRLCEHERVLFDGDDFAALLRVTAQDATTARVLSFRLAAFAIMRDKKLASLRLLFDSLDLAEQAIGRPLDLSAVA